MDAILDICEGQTYIQILNFFPVLKGFGQNGKHFFTIWKRDNMSGPQIAGSLEYQTLKCLVFKSTVGIWNPTI